MLTPVHTWTLAAVLLGSACVTPGSVDIGPEGGVLVTDDGLVELVVPPGALTRPERLTAVFVDTGPDDAVGPAVTFYPARLVFQRPAQILYEAEGLGEDVVLVGQTKAGWTPLPDADFDEPYVLASVIFLTTVVPIATD